MGLPRSRRIQAMSGVLLTCGLLFTTPAFPAPAAGTTAQEPVTSSAIWVSQEYLAWKTPQAESDRYELRHEGGTFPMTPVAGGLPPELAQRFPHLAGMPVFRVDAPSPDTALRGRVTAAHLDPNGSAVAATGVQIAGVLDERYAPAATKLHYGPRFDGGVPSLRLWAPTAKQVRLRLFDGTPAPDAQPSQVIDAVRDDASGSWSVTGDVSWVGRYYQYEVTAYQSATGRAETAVVTDPHSVALTADSTHSQLADLSAPEATPSGWQEQVARGLDGDPTEHGITELHVRDFSRSDATVPDLDRGTYRAFGHPDSAGMRHLRRLAEAGMDTVHLLPTFDIATIPERRENQQKPSCDLPALPPDSDQQQKCVGAIAASDAFNWGYDPLHYDTPEGSYATPDAQTGSARSKQYREMVKSLHDNGNRVVVDVVYNHTAEAGNEASSVLDKIVPGYYHRLLDDGSIATSTCCANTAPENAMMNKLVVDSVVHWARTYKVDGFRFDLMGHHPKANILAVRQALDALTPEKDGVDGKNVRIYGEGWDFGEVAGNARFEQATQANLAGTGVGTFNDRLRDAVRGGSVGDEDPRTQGLATGLAGDPNGAPSNGDDNEQAARLTNYADLVKLGMAGNGADFRFRSTTGPEVVGRDVSYNGAPGGYTAAPAEAITYADAHDNATFFDALAFKLPPEMPMEQRVRMHVLAMAPALLGQGQPFVHAGSEFLRSKSLDGNSYDSGDWFNPYDPSLRDNGFGRGLPPEADNGSKWQYAKPLLADPAHKPGPGDMQSALDATLDLLRIRQSSPLFTLNDAAQIQQKLSFPDPGAGPGVVVAHLDDTAGSDIDPDRRGILVVINPRPEAQQVALPDGGGWALHPIQEGGAAVKGLAIRGETAEIPARTVAVLTR